MSLSALVLSVALSLCRVVVVCVDCVGRCVVVVCVVGLSALVGVVVAFGCCSALVVASACKCML